MPSDHPQPVALDSLPFVWITGQARSGTTVVTRAIAAHPQILCNGRENNFLGDLIRFVKSNVENKNRMRQCLMKPEEFAAAYRTATFEAMFPPSFLQRQATLEEGLQRFRATAAFSSLNLELADFANSFFQQVHWVMVIRNGIEVVSSRMQHWNLAGHDFEDHCRAWADAGNKFRWVQQRPNATVIRHEWLLDPDRAAVCFADLQQRLALDPSDAPLRFVTENRVSGRMRGDTGPLDRSVLATRSEAWRDWTSEQRDMYKKICGETARLLGYPIPF